MDKVDQWLFSIGIYIDSFWFNVKFSSMLVHVLSTATSVFDCHTLLNDFYETHVRLGKDRREALTAHREANLERLSAGLKKLGPIAGAPDYDFDAYIVQGSYAMHTLNQHPENDYDIDTGVIFRSANICKDPREARRRVAQALREGGGNFKRAPECRANAVTVWYVAGHHVDLAIYRRNGSGVEHAGGDTWNPCDPEDIPKWFKEQNKALSPKSRPDQFRRVVRWIKSFAKSRKTWNMPGGMILSALAAEVYKPHRTRDDVALLDTFTALNERLQRSTSVANPAGGTLTGKQKYIDRVAFLRDKLSWLLPKLEHLRNADCTVDDAKRAWRWVFNHSFWETPSNRAAVLAGSGPGTLRVRADIAATKNGKIMHAYQEGMPLVKGRYIRFIAEDIRLSPFEEIHWIVENTGHEAVEADDLGHVTTGRSTENWERTAYAGKHRMICEVRQGAHVIARGVRHVNIS